MAVSVVEIITRQKNLGNGVIVLGEQLIIDVHQLALTDSRRRLLGGHIRGSLAQSQLAYAHADRARGY